MEPTTTSPVDMMAEFGLADLPEEERNELLAEIGEIVHRGVMQKAWNILDLAKQDALTELLEASNLDPDNDEKRDAVDQFMQAEVPDLERYIREEVATLKKAHEDLYGELTS
jgi:hypothetical protein